MLVTTLKWKYAGLLNNMVVLVVYIMYLNSDAKH